MRIGYYKDDLEEIEADTVEDAAERFAEDKHQVDEESDLKFELYVEDDEGKMFIVKMFTEYDPVYEIDVIKPV